MCPLDVLLFLFAGFLQLHPTQQQLDVKIVGGQVVTARSEFPYQASLLHDNTHICGGSLIDERHVLTAAHCVVDYKDTPPTVREAEHFTVAVGHLRRSNKEITKQVKYIFTHEDFEKAQMMDNDIAVLRVSEPFTFTENVQPVDLATSLVNDGTYCNVSGWGRIFEGALSLPDRLQYVTIQKLPTGKCNDFYSHSILSGMFCAGNFSGSQDACQGDSGGPLVCNKVQHGIVSWGYGCAKPNYPGVYTDLSFYRHWIEEQVKRSSANILVQYPLLMSVLFLFLTLV